MAHPFPFKAVVFDMDGVIVDSEAAYVAREVQFLRELHVDVPYEDVCKLVGSSSQIFKRVLASWYKMGGVGTLTPDEALERFSAWEAQNVVYDYAALMNPGVPETLTTLRDWGVRLALASSSRMENILDVLAQCGLSDMFEVIVSGEDFRESKPNPEIYLHAIERMGLEARDCCCVEDSVYGIEAGKRAGLTVFAKREERFGFSQDEADHIIDQIPDLLTVEVRMG